MILSGVFLYLFCSCYVLYTLLVASIIDAIYSSILSCHTLLRDGSRLPHHGNKFTQCTISTISLDSTSDVGIDNVDLYLSPLGSTLTNINSSCVKSWLYSVYINFTCFL